MSKISKDAAKRHKQALDLVHSDRHLTLDDRFFILENFHEGATNINGLAGAFFTPEGLARDFAIEVCNGKSLIDLCAGIGRLSFACRDRAKRIVCVEQNPDYAAVGMRVMPEAEWIVGDVFTIGDIGHFKWAISNPPFGAIKTSSAFDGVYSGARFEYKLIELASRIADNGAFIIPQSSAPFRYSGRQSFKEEMDKECAKFVNQTGIVMGNNCGIDTALYKDEWKGVSPVCEIVVCEFAVTTAQSIQLPAAVNAVAMINDAVELRAPEAAPTPVVVKVRTDANKPTTSAKAERFKSAADVLQLSLFDAA